MDRNQQQKKYDRTFQDKQTLQMNISHTRSHKILNKNSMDKHIQKDEIEKTYKIKNILMRYACSYIINVISNHKAYESSYMIFLVPCALLLAKLLSYFQENQKNLLLYTLFCQVIKSISKISKIEPIQMKQTQCRNYLITILSYKQKKNRIDQVLSTFLHTYKEKMSTFIPCYYLYFDLIANKSQKLKKASNIAEINLIIKQVQRQFQKYNNNQL